MVKRFCCMRLWSAFDKAFDVSANLIESYRNLTDGNDDDNIRVE